MKDFQRYFIDVITKNFANFNGRVKRKEYWMFVLFNLPIAMVISFISLLIFGNSLLQIIYMLGIFLPSLGISVRRLHDIGKCGYWLFIGIIPIIGSIWLIILMTTEGTKDINEFGAAPKEYPAV